MSIICRSLLILSASLSIHWTGCVAEDLYETLGIARSATTAQIKKAYRQKALQTHPDKNPGKDPEVAAEEFRKVTDAYSVLSDESSRKLYDRTGSVGGQNQGWQQQQQHHHHWNFQWNFRRRNPWDHPKVKEAQSYVIQVSTFEHLETIALDLDTDLLERNLLIVFCTPMTEKAVDEEVLFPYPFGGMSAQNIWWEDMLLTAKVRYNSKSDIAEKWGITDLKTPTFAFVRRGLSLDRENVQFLSKPNMKHDDFSDWMWKNIQVEVTFVNYHDHDVNLYWINGRRANRRGIIPPGQQLVQNSMLTHEWMVRDTRVTDFGLNDESTLGHWWIKTDTERVFEIRTKPCMDWNGNCVNWASWGECPRNPGYMLSSCRLSCKVCDPKENEVAADGEGGDGQPGREPPSWSRDEL